MTSPHKPGSKSAQRAVAKGAQIRPFARWREHFEGIVSSAFREVATRRFPGKGHAAGMTLPYASAGRLYGATYSALARAIATDTAVGKPSFVLQATDEELAAFSSTRLQRPVDKDLLKDYASLLKKEFGAAAAIESEKGTIFAFPDRRFRVQFHFKTADAVRFFWLDLWERLGEEEHLVFTTAEYGPTRTLSHLLEAGPGQFGPAEAYSDAQLDGFVAELPPDRQEALYTRLRERLDKLRRALFAPIAFVFKTPVGVAIGGVLLAVSIGVAVAMSRHPSRPAGLPPAAPPTPRSLPDHARPTPPVAAVPRDVAEIIRTWPASGPPEALRPTPPSVVRPQRIPIGFRDDDCASTIRDADRARAPMLCGRFLRKTPYGFDVATTVAFPIADTTRRYFARVRNLAPSNPWQASVLELAIRGTVAEETFVLPVPSQGHIWAPIQVELFSVDDHLGVRLEAYEVFPLVS